MKGLYIARQPIFTKGLSVYGYELLYRATEDSKIFTGGSSMNATASVLYGLLEIGIEKIVDGKKSFVNFDENFLASNAIELFDPNNLIIEVLEDVEVDDDLVERLEDLSQKGYRIALDDFVEDLNKYPLVDVANIIKYDIIATPLDSIKREVKRALFQNKIILAEKVETKEEFLQAKRMGFHLFQGFFFSKPAIIGKIDEKESRKLQYTRLIAELRKEEPSYQRLSEMIEKDLSMSYSLLKIVGHRKGKIPVYSIKRALVRMGLKEIEMWVNMMMMRNLSEKKPKELTKLSLIRSKFGEYVAVNSTCINRKFEISLMGLFSALDALLDTTMEQALDGLLLTGDIKEALIDNTGRLNDARQLVLAYEAGDWDTVSKLSEKLCIDEDILAKGYLEAVEWTDKALLLL